MVGQTSSAVRLSALAERRTDDAVDSGSTEETGEGVSVGEAEGAAEGAAEGTDVAGEDSCAA